MSAGKISDRFGMDIRRIPFLQYVEKFAAEASRSASVDQIPVAVAIYLDGELHI
jgi:hypothetical protein